MKPQYEPKTLEQKLGYVVEEAGEVQAAIGKTIRWGLDSYNPELPPEERELNGDWVMREMRQLGDAMDRLATALISAGYEGLYVPDGERRTERKPRRRK